MKSYKTKKMFLRKDCKTKEFLFQLVVARPGNIAGCDCGPHMKDHFWPVDGKCYPHYERGPCKEDEQFRKHPTKEHGATCIVWGKTSNSNGY